MGVRVQAPDGRVWHVRRTPGWPPFRRLRGFPDFTWLDAFAPFGGTIAVVIAVILLAFAIVITLFLPLLLFVAEGVVAALGVVIVLRSWRVAAQAIDSADRLEWRVRGWRRSRRAVKQVAAQIAAGTTPVERW